MPKQTLKEQIATQPQPRSRARATTAAQPLVEQQSVQPQPPQHTLRLASTQGGNAQTIDTRQRQAYQPEALTLNTSSYKNGSVPLQETDDDEYAEESQDEEVAADDEQLYSTGRKTSVVRWDRQRQHPIAYTKPQGKLVPQRARRLNPDTEQHRRAKKPKREFHPAFGVGIALICVCIGIALTIFVPPQVQKWRDQQMYGYPRTYQVNANVGHSSQQAPLSHLIAWNDNGTIKVLDTPEGDPNTYKPHLYIIATFTGPNADLIPVTISFASVRHNGKLDLIVQCNGTQYVWYNNGQIFSPQAS